MSMDGWIDASGLCVVGICVGLLCSRGDQARARSLRGPTSGLHDRGAGEQIFVLYNLRLVLLDGPIRTSAMVRANPVNAYSSVHLWAFIHALLYQQPHRHGHFRMYMVWQPIFNMAMRMVMSHFDMCLCDTDTRCNSTMTENKQPAS